MGITRKKMRVKIPDPVKEAFDYYVKNFKAEILFLGVDDGAAVYRCDLPGDTESGFPLIVKYKDGRVAPVDGIDAVSLTASLKAKRQSFKNQD